jgi:hypothetical protein
MAGMLTLNVRGLVNSGRGSWDAVGTSNVVTAVSDSTDSTYIKVNAVESGYSGPYGQSIKYYTTPQQLPGGAKTRYMRAVCRAKTSNASQEQYFRLLIQNYAGGNIEGNNWTSNGPQLFASTTFKEIANTADSYTRTNGQLVNGGVIDQTAINNLAIEVYNVEGINTIQVSKLWIEVYYDEKPTVTLTELGTVTNTTSPVLTWSFTDDLETQAAIDVQILNNSGTVLHSVTKYAETDGFYSVPISLPNGTYKARVRAHQAWKWTGDAPVSDWDEIDFTIAISAPATPTVTATEQESQARVKLTVEHNLNLLPQGVAEAEVAGWEAVGSVSLYTGAVFETGDRSLIAQTAGVNASVRCIPAVPVTAGQVYGFSYKSRPYGSDTPINVKACIRWINAAGGTISDEYSIDFLEIAGQWKTAFHTATAPAGAVYAKPFMALYSGGSGHWHYLDSPIFAPVNAIGAPIPAWSRGGFASETINMLSYGDSTLDGVSHWTPNEVTSSVSVVDMATESLDAYYQYQGDFAMKISTVNPIIARRDNETAVLATGTALVINKGDVLEGDFMVALLETNSTSVTVTPPAGWTLHGTQDASTTVRTWVYTKTAGAYEASTYTFTMSASGKHAGLITSYRGVNAIFASAKAAVTTSTSAFAMPSSTTPHNGYVVEWVAGVRAASVSATTWTSNLTSPNYDAQLSTTANTANEIAFGVYSAKYVTESTTAATVSGITQTSSVALPTAVTWTIVLQPTRTTVRATLGQYEYYEYDSTKLYVVSAAVLGADWGTINSANRTASFVTDVYDNNKSIIASYYSAQTTVAPGEWKRMTAVSNIPDNAAIKYATIRLEVDQMTDNEAYYFDAISLYQSDTNLGFLEGYKTVDGPYIELQQSEDDGDTWKTISVAEVADPTVVSQDYYDYEIASETPRIYRAFNWKVEELNLLQSPYSASTAEQEIKLRNIWLHAVTDPASSIHNFFFDGGGRDDSFNKNVTVLQFAGREYGQAHFSEGSERVINANISLPDKADMLALKSLNNTRAMIIFRDGRGRRVQGLLEVKLTDSRWGNTASLSLKVLGVQP